MSNCLPTSIAVVLLFSSAGQSAARARGTDNDNCLGSAGSGEGAFPVSVDFRPFGAGIFKAFGVYRPMTFAPFGTNSARAIGLRQNRAAYA